MNAFAEKCIKLRRQDHTLDEIARVTGRPRSSVFGYIWNLPLSLKKRQNIRDKHTATILKFIEKRRARSAKAFRRFRLWDKKTVFLVSHFIFDGEIRHGGCIYSNRSTALINRVKQGMKVICRFNPKSYKNEVTGVLKIAYFNVVLGAYIKKKATQLLEEILTLPIDLRREFTMSFFDDEGCMDFNSLTHTRRIRGYQKNTDILFLIQKLLSNFGITSKIVHPNEVVITGKENLIKFQREINFSYGVRINGNRPNSIWKKHLEKREILQRAIESYKI